MGPAGHTTMPDRPKLTINFVPSKVCPLESRISARRLSSAESSGTRQGRLHTPPSLGRIAFGAAR